MGSRQSRLPSLHLLGKARVGDGKGDLDMGNPNLDRARRSGSRWKDPKIVDSRRRCHGDRIEA
jgi:hypothetical protein